MNKIIKVSIIVLLVVMLIIGMTALTLVIGNEFTLYSLIRYSLIGILFISIITGVAIIIVKLIISMQENE